jgi:hypothetical protein
VARCEVCFETGVAGTDVYKCGVGRCGLYYHRRCLADVVGSGPMLRAAVLQYGQPVEVEQELVRYVLHYLKMDTSLFARHMGG